MKYGSYVLGKPSRLRRGAGESARVPEGTNLLPGVSNLTFAEFPPRKVFIMFELFELILTSPIGAYIFAGFQNTLYAVIIATDCDDCGFNDLGKLLFGGVIAAILAGVVISILLRRLKEKTPAATEFVSIMSHDRKP
jgi:hypothetical protein